MAGISSWPFYMVNHLNNIQKEVERMENEAENNSHDHETYDVPSYIYWGGADGFTAARRQALMSFGAVSAAIGWAVH